MMDAYNQRQYQLMLDKIQQFQKDEIGLTSLIADLEALLECLQNANEAWKYKFREEWTALEIEQAVALDRGQKDISRERLSVINSSIANIKALISDVILTREA